MEEKNIKKKNIIGCIVSIIVLLTLIIGATYGFFAFTTSDSKSTTDASIKTGSANLISLTGGTSKLHIIVDGDDMSVDNVGKSFYATTEPEKNYLTEEEEHTFNLANISVDGKNIGQNNCTANLVITIDGDLKEVLQEEDTLLHVEGIDEELNIDLAELKEEGTKTYPFELTIYSSSPDPIVGYLKLVNRFEDQSDLADKEINVTLVVQDLKCSISKGFSTTTTIASNPQIETKEHMQERGDTLRRFQGKVENDGNGNITSDINNYICFGTSDKATCLEDTDKYMYRIIGIDTTNNELKLIKRESLNTTMQWGGERIAWEDSDLQINLNKDFLSSLEGKWSNLISSHNWGYGTVPAEDYGIDVSTTSLQAYQHEKNLLIYTLNAKIGLMYISDYYLSGGDNQKCLSSSSSSNDDYVECKKSWLHLYNNDSASLSTTNEEPPTNAEWTMTVLQYNYTWTCNVQGSCGGGARGYTGQYSTRPVFYLKSDVKIIDGDGSMKKPYIIKEPSDNIYDAKDAILANSQLETAEHMQQREGDTLRRFQGQVDNTEKGIINNDINNYFCFGTDDQNECKKNTDQYIYRIIGIDTTTNELKLIKKESLNPTTWGSSSQNWGNSDLQIGLNGDLFLKNKSGYSYMQEDEKNTKWTNIISPHDWNYGDISSDDAGFNGQTTGIEAYQIEKDKMASGIINAKIGLMYVSDYYLSVGDDFKCYSNGAQCKKSWLNIFNNDTDKLSSTNSNAVLDEWAIPRVDYNSAWYIYQYGSISKGTFSSKYSVRPVFYLSSNIKLSGDGSIFNPYYVRNLNELYYE